MPQQTSLQAPYQKSYLRENAWDAFAQDDWRALPSLTLLFGLRYEYFSPYSEKYDHLSTLDTGNNFASVATVLSKASDPIPANIRATWSIRSTTTFLPRIGFAVRAAKDTVVRGGFGINYAMGQYAKFVQDFAFEPPYANVQTNVIGTNDSPAVHAGQGFPPPQANNLATTRSTSTIAFLTCRSGT